MNIGIKKILADIRSTPFVLHAEMHNIKALLEGADCARFSCEKIRLSAKEFSVIKITYDSDECTVEGYIAVPHNIVLEKENKTAIVLRGGNNDFGKIKDGYIYHPNTYFSWMPLDGYITFYTQYRQGTDGECKDEVGGADVNDVIVLQKIMQNIPWCDSDKVDMLGWSRGGQMIYQTLRDVDWVRGAVVIAAPADHIRMIESGFRSEWKEHMKKICGGSEKALKKRSAIYWADEILPVPILLIHGDTDEQVMTQDSQDMHALLPKSTLHTIKGGDHSLKEQRNFLREYIHTWLLNI